MPTAKNFLGLTFLLIGLLLCAAGLWQLLGTPRYQAITRIEINRNPSFPGQPPDTSYDPYFIQTEFEVIQSELVLSNVAVGLNLAKPWGNDVNARRDGLKTIQWLKHGMSLRPIRNTKLIELSFTGTDRKEAAKIANAIAAGYQAFRLERWRQATREKIKTLEDHFKDDEEKIKTKQTTLDQSRKQLNVPDPEPSDDLLKSNYPSYLRSKQDLQNMLAQHKLLETIITNEKVNLQTPKTFMIQIVDAAVPPKSSSWPNRPLGAVLLFSGLVFSAMGSFFLRLANKRPA